MGWKLSWWVFLFNEKKGSLDRTLDLCHLYFYLHYQPALHVHRYMYALISPIFRCPALNFNKDILLCIYTRCRLGCHICREIHSYVCCTYTCYATQVVPLLPGGGIIRLVILFVKLFNFFYLTLLHYLH